MVSISVIIPFFNGNRFLCRALKSIVSVYNATKHIAAYEIIIVNDSPDCKIVIPPDILPEEIKVHVIINTNNIGIHRSRIAGLEKAAGDWILFLDQDDELLPEGFVQQIQLTSGGDLVVGNGFREYENSIYKPFYYNIKQMSYLINQRIMIEIGDTIPSPGLCLVRKNVISHEWMEKPLKHNGADDWMLWLVLFHHDIKVVFNNLPVYIHHYTKGENISYNPDKAKASNEEMIDSLHCLHLLSENEERKMRDSVEIRYHMEKKDISISDIIRHAKAVFAGVKYRANRLILSFPRNIGGKINT